MEAATTASTEEERSEQPASSFAKSLFLGEIHEEMVFPWPQPDADEQDAGPRPDQRGRASIGDAHRPRARSRRSAGSATT